MSHGTVGLVLGIVNSFDLHHLGVDGLQAKGEVELKQSQNERNNSKSPEVKVGGPWIKDKNLTYVGQ